jgi:RNA polymerase sigma-70 factor (ECF subfamily)
VDGGRQDDNPYEDRVRMTMLQLKSDYRIVLVLHYFQSLSYQEIAQTLHCSLDQVRVRIHRAKRAFRLVWGKEGGPYDL